MKTTCVLLLAFALLPGCATPPKGAMVVDDPGDLPTVQAQLADRLSKLEIGMPLADFRRLMPEAYVGGQNLETTAYELAKSTKYVTKGDIGKQNFWYGVGSPQTRSKREVLWFYFYRDQLVQWGNPGDWPDKPDLILETRNR